MASGVVKRSALFTNDWAFSSFATATNYFTPTINCAACYVVEYTGSDSNAPVTSSAAWRWNVWDFGANTRRTQIATCPYRSRDTFYMRQKHDSNWYGWYTFMGQRYKSVALSINTQANVSGNGVIVVSGRVAVLTATIKYPSTGTNLSLAWIPERSTTNKWLLPEVDMWLSCNYYSSSGKQCEVKMTSGGSLVFNTTEGNVDMKVHGSWITKGLIPEY